MSPIAVIIQEVVQGHLYQGIHRQPPLFLTLAVILFPPDTLVIKRLPSSGLTLSLRLDMRHKGSYYEDHLNVLKRDAVTTFNMSANFRNDNWTFRAYIDNVTDVTDPVRIFPANNYVTGANPAIAPAAMPGWAMVPRRPREMGVQLQYSF